MIACPECAGEILIPEDAMKGEIFICGDCGESFELISLDPVKLNKAESQGEDWGQ